jgi:hypothetical protein
MTHKIGIRPTQRNGPAGGGPKELLAKSLTGPAEPISHHRGVYLDKVALFS